RCVEDSGMSQEQGLELRRRHLEALVLDQLLRAIDDEEPSLLVDVPDVAGAVPAVAVDRIRRVLRPVEIALHDLRSADEQLTLLTYAESGAGDDVDNSYLGVGHDLADRPRLGGRVARRAQMGDRAGLRHAIALHDRASELPTQLTRDFLAKRRRAREHHAHARQIESRYARVLS